MDDEMTITMRAAREADYDAVAAAIADWWTLPEQTTPEAKRERAALAPRLWLQHFAQTSLIAEREADGEIVAFLIGFPSPDRSDEAYIHFVGVHPDARTGGLGRMLYERFFDESRKRGRSRVRCVTSPANDVSIGFHLAMGFTIEPGNKLAGDLEVKADYDGVGLDRVAFVREL
jgi:ribosomal protein S18 acetylase RimI-like enzyme